MSYQAFQKSSSSSSSTMMMTMTRLVKQRTTSPSLSTKRFFFSSSLYNNTHNNTRQNQKTLLKKVSALTATTATASFAAAAACLYYHSVFSSSSSFSPTLTNTTMCEMKRKATDVLMIGNPTKEPSTGILFPQLCNGLTFVGCGVRVKYGFVKVYAVGTYIDPKPMSLLKTTDEITQALNDPLYPKTIRIVMNRSLSIEKYTAAIVEALEPRMKGEDLDKLEEFKKLNPPIDLIQGAEMEMTIRGNTMLYKNSVGGVGAIHSKVFCEALCDVYYGKDAVSPTHREDVIKGIQKL